MKSGRVYQSGLRQGGLGLGGAQRGYTVLESRRGGNGVTPSIYVLLAIWE